MFVSVLKRDLYIHAQQILIPKFSDTRKLAVIYLYSNKSTGVNQKVLPVLSTETLLHIWLSTEYYGFRPSSTAVDTVS